MFEFDFSALSLYSSLSVSLGVRFKLVICKIPPLEPDYWRSHQVGLLHFSTSITTSPFSVLHLLSLLILSFLLFRLVRFNFSSLIPLIYAPIHNHSLFFFLILSLPPCSWHRFPIWMGPIWPTIFPQASFYFNSLSLLSHCSYSVALLHCYAKNPNKSSTKRVASQPRVFDLRTRTSFSSSGSSVNPSILLLLPC